MGKLGEELWKEIETVQGFAFISDDLCLRSDAYILPRLRGALKYQRKGVRIMEKLLRKYDSPRDSGKEGA
jgi:hypothetical protein